MKRNEAMDVYKGRLEKFKNTQSIQWKMNLSIWTLLVLAIYYSDNIKLDACFLFAFLLAICVIHFWYCILTQKSLNSDKAINDDIINQLNKTQDDNQSIIVTYNKGSGRLNLNWVILQGAITVILAIVLYLLCMN